MNKVTVVIPTYFAGQMLSNCVSSIMQYSKNVKVLIFKNDIGWIKACNEAITSVDTDILLINDDIIAVSDLVKEMSELAYSDSKIGIVGGKSLEPTGEKIQNYGIYIAPDGNSAHKHFGQPRNSVRVENQKAVEGSCIYIKREVIEEIGLLDEAYVAYREEVDYCFRTKEAGYKIVSCPTAEYIHFTSQTHGRLGITNDSMEYFMSLWGKKLKLGLI